MATSEITKSMRQVAQVAIIICELCDQNKKGTWSCTDCDEAMCNQCKVTHLRSKASCNHTVVLIAVQTEDEPTPIFCEIHKSVPIQMHCIECNVGLCVNCITETSTHKSHGLIKVQEVIDNMKTELKGIISESHERITSSSNWLQRLQDHKEKYSKEAQECIESIKTRGDIMKADIDKVIKEFIQEIETSMTTDLDLIQEKEVQKTQEKEELEKFKAHCEGELKKASGYGVTTIMKELQEKMEQIQTSSITISLEVINPPYFTPIQTDNKKLKEIFGRLGGIDTTMISSFKPDITITGIAAVDENHAWVAYRGNDKKAYLVTKNGGFVREITPQKGIVEVFTVSKTGHLIITFSGSEAVFQETESGLKKIINTHPFKPQGLCSTQEDDVLVSLTNYAETKIVRYSLTGEVKQTIQYDQEKKPLFKHPLYLEENINKDVCVLDEREKLRVVDKNGCFRFQYSKAPGVEVKVKLYQDVTCDKLGHILISDELNSFIHLLSMNGQFIKFIFSGEEGIKRPWGLSFDSSGQLWIQDDGVKVFKYHAYEKYCFSTKNK